MPHPFESPVSCFTSFYQQAGHEIRYFGDIAMLYANSHTHNFNFIFDAMSLSDTPEYRDNLAQALACATQKAEPVAFIRTANTQDVAADIVKQHGYEYAGRFRVVSLAHEKGIQEKPPQHAYTVKRVQDTASFKVWCDIMDESFQLPAGDAYLVCSPVGNELLTSDMFQFYVLLNADNTPIAITMLYLPVDKTRPASQYCWGTRAGHRQQGAMRYLAQETLKITQDLGYDVTEAQCADTSFNIAISLGFEAGEEMSLYLQMTKEQGPAA